MNDRPSKLVPALIGGVVLAALSTVPVIHVGCCLWGMLGGGIAAYMLIRRSPAQRVMISDGALTGMLAGVFGSLLYLLINIPIVLTSWTNGIEQLKDQARDQADPKAQAIMNQIVGFMEENGLLAAFVLWLVFALVAVGMATLGGIIGVALFEKRKGNQPPPAYPPSDYPPNYPSPSA